MEEELYLGFWKDSITDWRDHPNAFFWKGAGLEIVLPDTTLIDFSNSEDNWQSLVESPEFNDFIKQEIQIEQLKYDLCIGCGQIQPIGLIENVLHSQCCPFYSIDYRTQNFTMRQFHHLISGIDPLQPFKDLLHFRHFNKMPNYETASITEKRIYRICREDDVRTMKRLRQYIKLEADFNSRY